MVYNQLSASILELDNILYNCLTNDTLSNIPNDVQLELAASSILVDENLDERNVILYKVQHSKFNESTARVTIMPTLNCNFSCWYCYESHHDSKMTTEGVDNVIRFCQKLIRQKNIKSFQLDWFGGEPLLYFHDIVFPISQEVKNACDSNEVTFINSITTNGYLIDEEIIHMMKKVNLSSFQITLDGAAKYHNRTRFSDSDKNSYKTIVNNITCLCRNIPNVNMTVRINYTPKNIISVPDIIEDFPSSIREKIQVCPQLVWQFKKNINATTDKIKDILYAFQNAGYKVHKKALTCHQCYAESMNQFVINYDMTVYKCTARDFTPKHSVGKISEGEFIPNCHYFDYCIPTDILEEKCRDCKMLPSCLGRCVQKRVEGNSQNCDPKVLEQSTINDVMLYINANEEDETCNINLGT